ncbi:hypothetical protein B4123_2360 [Bacillus paralicheniformis]|uniref:Uncharacterized protein n=1 Tax=Bacillus paralicheniformis TaxID=1648923 RepID=A0A6I7UEP3_9BACI|nr:hypothetical protein B4121_3164 [Bacillus paralicheniformis]OLG07579.1 hypothetical protein B4125_1760 [Bacillus paralicheniformis]OLG11199.1 hypothetical protein B4123_2360 [Bacillus paralicheniformis]TWJ37545.1 hypothetical protein CHCC5027_1043 [Bacillus paralicheniformis]TWJ58632.1 hypothetical protein CHCC5022_3487 [Bacillus paralicheniformis]
MYKFEQITIWQVESAGEYCEANKKTACPVNLKKVAGQALFI